MILKVLLVIGVITIVYFMFFKKKNISTSSKKNKKKDKTNDMVECANCSVYCDIDEAILSNANYYCSKECIAEAS